MATLVNNNVMSMFNGQLKSNDNNMHAHTGKYLRTYVCLCICKLHVDSRKIAIDNSLS